MNLRSHQIKFSKQLSQILNQFNIAYLAGQVRSGKTLTALESARLFNAKKILVVTKKKAISSIQSDYENFCFSYEMQIMNYESLHKITDKDFDLIIYDESHSLGAYPKPSQRAKLARKMFYDIPTILMTGTSAVESYSQYYHQFYVSKFSPFNEYKNFYKWAKDFVTVKQLKLPTHTVNDYSKANVEAIDKIIKPYMVVMTQADAGLDVNINETILEVETPPLIKKLTDILIKDRVVQGQSGFIFGDSPAKLQSKVHQLFNGSCIIETATGETFTKLFSNFKADYIAKHFKGKKIVIMYYYQAELEILKKTFDLADDVEDFNKTNKSIAVQQSSSEGMNLSKADAIVYYNIGFSGKNYIQSRDRMTVKERKNNNVYFICEKGGITSKILKRVRAKKDFNSRTFLKEYE
ncbi:MAG: DEAD/DEAH box helicase family protein [Candidatus Babeliales bacterium]